MNLRMLGDYILVQEIERGDKVSSASRILMPDSYKKRPCIGIVKNISIEWQGRDPLNIDDVVIFDMYAGEEFEWNDVKYRKVHRSDLYAIVWGDARLEFINGGCGYDGFINQYFESKSKG